MTDPLDPAPPPEDPGNIPPHQVPVAVPMEVSGIHVWAHGRCMAAFVVNVDSEDPLKAVFTVDAVIFQPPFKGKRDKFDRGGRPGVIRWATNMHHAPPSHQHDLTWHYPGRECLPEVVLRALAEQE